MLSEPVALCVFKTSEKFGGPLQVLSFVSGPCQGAGNLKGNHLQDSQSPLKRPLQSGC